MQKAQIKTDYYPLPNIENTVTNKFVTDHMLASPLTFSTAFGEVVEVFEELFTGNFKESAKEIHQVWYCILLLAYSKLSIVLPMFLAMKIVKEHADRHYYWAQIFSRFNANWDIKLFKDGTNWERPHKIVNTLKRANVEIVHSEAEQLIYKLKMNQTIC